MHSYGGVYPRRVMAGHSHTLRPSLRGRGGFFFFFLLFFPWSPPPSKRTSTPPHQTPAHPGKKKCVPRTIAECNIMSSPPPAPPGLPSPLPAPRTPHLWWPCRSAHLTFMIYVCARIPSSRPDPRPGGEDNSHLHTRRRTYAPYVPDV